MTRCQLSPAFKLGITISRSEARALAHRRFRGPSRNLHCADFVYKAGLSLRRFIGKLTLVPTSLNTVRISECTQRDLPTTRQQITGQCPEFLTHPSMRQPHQRRRRAVERGRTRQLRTSNVPSTFGHNCSQTPGKYPMSPASSLPDLPTITAKLMPSWACEPSDLTRRAAAPLSGSL
jgi:hypothetical protein